MNKQISITSFFKRKRQENDTISVEEDTTPINEDINPTTAHNQEEEPYKRRRIDIVDIDSLERDPGLRPPIWDYPAGRVRNEVRRAYIKLGPYQPKLDYPFSGPVKHRRRFQSTWFKNFPDWLEYSPSKDAAFCVPCYLFTETPDARVKAFTLTGFKNWKKVNDGKHCGFLAHVGEGPCTIHRSVVQSYRTLPKQKANIRNVINKQSERQIKQNRLRLKASIDVLRLLTTQGCPLRGHDESKDSHNQGNYLEFRKTLAIYNKDVGKAIRQAPYNSKYNAPSIQKEILHIISNMVRKNIRQEIEDSKFCIIVDEARDESKREQMGLVLRFVDRNGTIRERFFDLIRVSDTSAATLKRELCSVLSRHELAIENIRGQGYDGASNIRGEWNGLQALFLSDCPYAYYVHCYAHRLQLALVAASRDVSPIHQFFSNLTFIVNVIAASPKRLDELHATKAAEIKWLLSIGEIESGRGANQMGTLKRAGDTRWGSHLHSIRSFLKMFNAIVSVLEHIMADKSCTYSQRGDADGALNLLISFDFVFIAHLMEEILRIADVLCQALQQKSQDIVNAIKLVSTSQTLIQEMRENGWESFLDSVGLFCQQHDILVPNMNAPYLARRDRARHQQDQVTMNHFYRVEIFLSTIDKQLQELNRRFNDNALELLTLSSLLEPKDGFKQFDINKICILVEKYYPKDFTEQERYNLKDQLQHFICEVKEDQNMRNYSTLEEVCEQLAKTGKSNVYFLFDRLIRLILTLPVSTATTERAFSTMKIMKTRLRNKMEDEFLADSLVIYIEREISKSYSTKSIIDDLKILKDRRALL
ncbi:uncharacterized protein LOC104884300 [Beta vulgaris subsp. vulgaris]|uniref:uncharacterized protein LOC104884300 n=1 Tax=Beta vulgaris subsp. vulgaris TaxID=3555 RepID=UPI0025478A32|nr:uncharacterized protein LOC104884300 [Beta vulgaris subsp. vulgaris]